MIDIIVVVYLCNVCMLFGGPSGVGAYKYRCLLTPPDFVSDDEQYNLGDTKEGA